MPSEKKRAMQETWKTSRTGRKACLAAVLMAATGGGLALGSSGIVRVAADDYLTSAPPAKSAPEAASDSAITSTIKTKLLVAIRDLKSTDGIQIKTRDGIVNVSGTVPSKQQHDMAIETIRSVDGVRSIHDSLKISTR